MIEFHEEGHSYKSIDILEDINWVSVTSLVSQFKEIFFPEVQAEKSSKNRKSKWYGMSAEEILAVWDAESKRSTTLGTWYHKERETELLACETLERKGKQIPIFAPIVENGVKIAPEQRLVEGIYPEHMVFLKSVGICGQVDRAEVVDQVLDVDDYKSNKEIKRESYRSWDGSTKRMLVPLGHLDDCTIRHYTLQLSLYAYIILKHNPILTVGDLTISHVTFEEEGRDKYDNPITRLDHTGSPIVKGVERIKVDYMKREVELMFDWLSKNRNNLRKKS